MSSRSGKSYSQGYSPSCRRNNRNLNLRTLSRANQQLKYLSNCGFTKTKVANLKISEFPNRREKIAVFRSETGKRKFSDFEP